MGHIDDKRIVNRELTAHHPQFIGEQDELCHISLWKRSDARVRERANPRCINFD